MKSELLPAEADVSVSTSFETPFDPESTPLRSESTSLQLLPMPACHARKVGA